MEVKLINQTHYANIYGLYDDGNIIGTKEVRLAGKDTGTYFDSWSSKSKSEIKKLFKEFQ
jgi:hypothetical protein